MQSVAQLLARFAIRSNQDMRRLVASRCKLRPQRPYVDVAVRADVTVSLMKLRYKVHDSLLLPPRIKIGKVLPLPRCKMVRPVWDSIFRPIEKGIAG
jgi:hypothetical protein